MIALATVLLATPAGAEETTGSPLSVSRSLAVPLSATGKLVIDETWGDLKIIAWDKPEVGIEFNASSSKAVPADETAATSARIARFGVEAKAVAAGEVHVTGINPSATLGSPFGSKSGIQTRYTLHVPRGAALVVRHGIGNIDVQGLTADIDVGGGTGEITLDVGLGLATRVEASTRVGDIQLPAVLSEVGISKRRAVIGESYRYQPEAANRRVVARLSIGSIDLR